METEHFTAAELETIGKKMATRVAAAMDPAPGPLAEAFLPSPAKVAGLELQPIVASHLIVLKRLGLHTILEDAKAKLEDEQAFELLYVFTRPIGEVRAAAAQGPEKFRDIAMKATADKLTLDSIEAVNAAVSAHLVKAFATVVEHKSPPAPDGSFPTPPQPATA